MIDLAIQAKTGVLRPPASLPGAPRHGFAAALSRSLAPPSECPDDDPRQEDADPGSSLPGDLPVQLPCGYVPPAAPPIIESEAPKIPLPATPRIADAAAPVILVPNAPAAAEPPMAGAEAGAGPPVLADAAGPVILVPLGEMPTPDQPVLGKTVSIRDTGFAAKPVGPAAIAVPSAAPLPIQPEAQPAGQLFGVALRQAASRDPVSVERTTARTDLGMPFVAATESAHAVAAVMHDAGASLDLRQDSWPRAMIEHIERLRDAADATDGSIRVVPSALGPIDVAVRRERDIVHVHFSAEQAATRALLGDAQPRLAEYAEARGLKLGQTSIGGDPHGGDAGTAHQHHPQRQPAGLPLAPQRPRIGATAGSDLSTRIA